MEYSLLPVVFLPAPLTHVYSSNIEAKEKQCVPKAAVGN